MFRVFTTREFDNDFDNLDGSYKERVRKILRQLREQGDSVGKPLRLSYFREKKFGSKRLYFLVYKEFAAVLSVGISNKKIQQATINRILMDLDEYKGFIIKELKNIEKDN